MAPPGTRKGIIRAALGMRQIPFNRSATSGDAGNAPKDGCTMGKLSPAAAIEYCLDGEGTQCRLSDSDLKPRTKKAIQVFFSRLNEQGLHGLQTQYHIIGKLSELPALKDVIECEELVQINDCGDDPVCYLPATRIKFAFSSKQKISAVFSQDGLSRLIFRLQGIHDEGSKAVARHRGAIRDLPVVG